MKLVEIKELPLDEISDQVKKSRLELVDLRMKFVSRQLEDPSLIKKKKKEVAQLLTVETQKLIEKAKTPESKVSKSLKKEKKSPEKKKTIKERKGE